MRRLAAMKYRLAGATYRVIAEKLTEERAQAYAVEKGISFERAMTRIKHVSTKTAWDDVTAEMEDLQADGTTRVFLREPRIGPDQTALHELGHATGHPDRMNRDSGELLTLWQRHSWALPENNSRLRA